MTNSICSYDQICIFFKTFFKLFDVLKVKNLFTSIYTIFFARFATFFDGSTPKILFCFVLKFFKKEPSFDPISIIFLEFFEIIFLNPY